MEILNGMGIKACSGSSPNLNPAKAAPSTFLQPAPTLALHPSAPPSIRPPNRPNQSKMTTMPSYFPNSTHDELLAHCHSDRSNHVGANAPKLMSSLDYDPAASDTDSDMTGFQRCASAEDSAVLARMHSTGRRRSSAFNVPKLMSSYDGCPAAHEGLKHHAFIPLPADAASAASTPTSSSLDAFLASSFGRL